MIKTIKRIIPGFLMKAYSDYKQKKMSPTQEGGVWCPICKSRFKIFAPQGVRGIAKRKNAKCLNCGSLERHRLLYLYYDTKTNLFDSKKNIKLLHFAPEKVFYNLFSTQQNIEYTPCDLFPDIYNYKGKTEVQKVDINDITFEENYFDAILCIHVLEHIPDDIHAMTELYRVMKKGGWGIFQVPIDYTRETTYEDFTITDPKEREKAFGQFDHVRWYGRDYKDRLQKVGFKVTEDDFVKRFSSHDLIKMGLKDSHLIYYCEK